MYKVNVKNPCNCFLKSGFVESQEFKTKEEAKEESNYLLKIMQSNFCQKHQFSLSEESDCFTIDIQPRT